MPYVLFSSPLFTFIYVTSIPGIGGLEGLVKVSQYI